MRRFVGPLLFGVVTMAALVGSLGFLVLPPVPDPPFFGAVNRDLHGADELWAFFARHTLPLSPAWSP